jgi:hypothetical protein
MKSSRELAFHITEILKFNIPQKWKAKMVEAGFVPANHRPTEIVEFCARLESAEQMLGLNNQPDCKKKQEQKGSKLKDKPEGRQYQFWFIKNERKDI